MTRMQKLKEPDELSAKMTFLRTQLGSKIWKNLPLAFTVDVVVVVVVVVAVVAVVVVVPVVVVQFISNAPFVVSYVVAYKATLTESIM